MQCADVLPVHRADNKRMPKNSLDTLEEELLSITNMISQKASKGSAPVEEREEEEPPEQDGWMEVGRRNRMVVTRTVGLFVSIYLIGTDRFIVGQNGGITNNSHIWW